eukprot:jgi/Botrbrau1/13246/Bobra.0199s0013.1
MTMFYASSHLPGVSGVLSRAPQRVPPRQIEPPCRWQTLSTPLLHPALLRSQSISREIPDRRLSPAYAAAPATDIGYERPPIPRWWERGRDIENVKDIGSAQEFLDEMAAAGDRLVVVDFYATWCNACRSIYPKLCQLAKENPNILVLKVDFDKSRDLVRPLGVKILPYFHFYHGADGLVTAFTASAKKVDLLRDAVAVHSAPRCSLVTPPGFPEIEDSRPMSALVTHNIVTAPASWQSLKEQEAAGV